MDNPSAKPLRFVAYLRVSSNAQVERATVEVQRREVQRWAKRYGHRIVRWCEDEAISGALDIGDRPGLSCTLSAVENGQADAVVMWKLDRLARALTVQEASLALLWRAGAQVYTVDQGEVLPDDPADPMRTAMRQMAGVFGQLERAMIRSRMESGRKAKADRGGYTGGRPAYGLRPERGELVENQAEAPTVARIVELRTSGESYRGIVATLNAEGRRTKEGHSWLPGTVRRVCLRAAPHLNGVGDGSGA